MGNIKNSLTNTLRTNLIMNEFVYIWRPLPRFRNNAVASYDKRSTNWSKDNLFDQKSDSAKSNASAIYSIKGSNPSRKGCKGWNIFYSISVESGTFDTDFLNSLESVYEEYGLDF